MDDQTAARTKSPPATPSRETSRYLKEERFHLLLTELPLFLKDSGVTAGQL